MTDYEMTDWETINLEFFADIWRALDRLDAVETDADLRLVLMDMLEILEAKRRELDMPQ